MPSAVSPKDIAASLLEYWSPRVVGAVDDTYVKAAPIWVKITPRAFSRDWQLPIVNRDRQL